MDKLQEFQRAKNIYRWLAISPLFTIPTLFVINAFGLGYLVFPGAFASSSLSFNADMLGLTIGVLASALWHLILFQYVIDTNSRNSAYVRKHAARALIHAGVRTGIALAGVGASWLFGHLINLLGLIAIALLIAWIVGITSSQEISKDKQRYLTEESPATDAVISANALVWQDKDEVGVSPVSVSASQQPTGRLAEVYQDLQNADESIVLQALASLASLNESSEAVRLRLEQLAVKSSSAEIRSRALTALDAAPNRALQKSLVATWLERSLREVILREVDKWQQAGLLGKQNAEVIRRRYDFDLAPAPASAATPPPAIPAVVVQPAPVAVITQPEPAPAAPVITPGPAPAAPVPVAAAATPPPLPQPQPTLLQTLTSEGAIKIYLYLGAFFVIAAAAILAAIVPELRLPILFVGTLLFGGTSVALKKRLPQPSFALFIVFSFLVLITAGSLEATLRANLNFSADFTNAFWLAIWIFMALVWAGSTWFYESFFFSIAVFVALILASFRFGSLFDLGTPVQALLLELTALVGLVGVWLLRKWKGAKFALPLFLVAQIFQVLTLAGILVNLGSTGFLNGDSQLLQLAALIAWGLGIGFYLGSERLFPFVVFPWLTAASLIPLPWFIGVAFEFEVLGWSLTLFLWGVALAVVSEPLARFEPVKKYGLPVLLASLPGLALGVGIGFFHEIWLGLTLALGGALLLTVLHVLRNRGLLWALALLNLSVAYFAFFQLQSIQNLRIFFGYPLVGITILFLLPDLFLKKDWSLHPSWRLPLRLFGGFFGLIATLFLLVSTSISSGHVAGLYFVLALFNTVYALLYRQSYLLYSLVVPTLLGIVAGFFYATWLGMLMAAGGALLLTVLHALRNRWALWALALACFAMAYFAFFQLQFIQNLRIFFGYPLVGITILFLLPDLFLKKDWSLHPSWRLPLRLFGGSFGLIATLFLLASTSTSSGHVAGLYFVLALFNTVYALLYRQSYLLYSLVVPTLLGIVAGFFYATWLGMLMAAGGALLLTVLHALRNRWALWALALACFATAYFAFFQLQFIQNLRIFFGYPLVGITILFLLPDLFLKKDWSLHLAWRLPLRLFGGFFLLAASFSLFVPYSTSSGHVAGLYFVLALFSVAYALLYRQPYLLYLPITYFALTTVYALDAFKLNLWRPALAMLAVAYYLLGLTLRNKQKWSAPFRYSSLTLGALVTLTALALALTGMSKGWLALGGAAGVYLSLVIGGLWYAALIAIGLLFLIEMRLSRRSWFEFGALLILSIAAFLLLFDFEVDKVTYHLLAYSLIWLLEDLFSYLTYKHGRPLRLLIHLASGLVVAANYILFFQETNTWILVAELGVYTLLFLALSLLYRQPRLLYAFTLSCSLLAGFFFYALDLTRWIHPVIVTAIFYYTAGALLRALKRAPGWEQPLLYSGHGLGLLVSVAALILGGADAAFPIAIAATFWAFEAFYRRNAWLAFPANALYLLAYFIVLFDLQVTEPQFFSSGVALFGLIQHYLLVRAKSKAGAFLMGMASQLSLLGTTYIEMVARNQLGYFFLLFVQALVILVYGIVIRSRSLTFFPIGFIVLGVVTVVYSTMKGTGSIILVGCTGILLIILGIGAVLLRERIAKLSEKLSDWSA